MTAEGAIEGLASMIVIWRFTGFRRLSEHAERPAQRLVAITFLLLAPYIALDAIRTLIDGERPSTSWLGSACRSPGSSSSPYSAAKHGIGELLGSGATAGEGAQNMLCGYLAASVLTGLALNAALGLWWADPAVALCIAALALSEGRHAWRGDGCCAASTIAHESLDNCQDDCCA